MRDFSKIYKPWIIGATIQDDRDPLFWHTDVNCGGLRIAKVSGVGKEESINNANRIIAGNDALNSNVLSIEKQIEMAEQFATALQEMGLKPKHKEWKIREASYYCGAIAVLAPKQVPVLWKMFLSCGRSIVEWTLKNNS